MRDFRRFIQVSICVRGLQGFYPVVLPAGYYNVRKKKRNRDGNVLTSSIELNSPITIGIKCFTKRFGGTWRFFMQIERNDGDYLKVLYKCCICTVRTYRYCAMYSAQRTKFKFFNFCNYVMFKDLDYYKNWTWNTR